MAEKKENKIEKYITKARPFNATVTLIIGNNDQITEYLTANHPKLKGPNDLKNATGAVYNLNNGILIWIIERSICTLAHELLHVAINILTKMGIDIKNDNGEVLCYLQEDLIDVFMKKMEDAGKPLEYFYTDFEA